MLFPCALLLIWLKCHFFLLTEPLLDKYFKFENGFTLKSTFSHSLQTLRQSQYMSSSVADITAPGKTQWILSDWCSYIDHVHVHKALDVPERWGLIWAPIIPSGLWAHTAGHSSCLPPGFTIESYPLSLWTSAPFVLCDVPGKAIIEALAVLYYIY